MRLLAILACLSLLTVLASCGEEGTGPKSASSESPVSGVTYDATGKPAGIERYRRWSERIGQGGQPVGEVGFQNLKALGFKTILSVDGAVPQVELAARYGLRYVHVPIGYDGISEPMALQIVKAARVSAGPIFVHCHHGKHRGPAAAMLCRISLDGISGEAGVRGLEESGTSEGYTGLYRDVGAFVAPSEEALAAVPVDLPSKVVPRGLRAAMVQILERWESLTLSKMSGWEPPADHPDVDPPHEARMLWESCRELGRTDEEARAKGEVFLDYLRMMEEAAANLEKALRAGEHEEADKQYAFAKGLCADCHRDYRN